MSAPETLGDYKRGVRKDFLNDYVLSEEQADKILEEPESQELITAGFNRGSNTYYVSDRIADRHPEIKYKGDEEEEEVDQNSEDV